jgi:hypothetical protein
MAALEVIALDTSVPQLMAPQAGDTYTFPRAVEMPLGTANGVLYLNGSKVVTSGSALTFDGTNFRNTSGAFEGIDNMTLSALVSSTNATVLTLNSAGTSGTTRFQINGSEQMRLNSTGLGIGTNNPASKLHVSNAAAATRITITDDVANGRSGYIESNFSDALVIGTTSGVRGIRFSPDNTPRMFLDTSGNLGIGTSSPSQKLEVNGNCLFTGGQVILNANTANYLYFKNASKLVFSDTVGNERMTLDSSGNLGLGVTPSAWNASGYKAFEIGGVGNGILANNVNDIYLSSNAYYNSGWKYGITANASQYEQYLGAHLWFTAASGTAGNPISFTQAMTLDASGNLLVGNTSLWSSERLGITGSSASQRFIYARTTSNGHYLSLGTNGTLQYIEYGNGAGLAFTDGATERARIDSSGNLGLGVTPSAWSTVVPIIQIGTTGAFLAAQNGSTNVRMGVNAYYNGGWLYTTTAAASMYQQANGAHSWHYAASGTAGNAISFTQAMTLDASGNLLVGTTTALSTVANGFTVTGAAAVTALGVGHVNGSGSGTNYVVFNYNNGVIGSITQDGTTGVLYNLTSDRRLKQNIVPAPSASAVIDAIQIVSHGWKSAPNEHVTYGVIAQDLHAVAPQAVSVGDDGDEIEKTWGVDYSKLVPMLIKEIQSLRARLAAAGI